ncbi:MAG: hypothetical protein LBJ08_05450, partial [Bifidobacteriaceae bacterium]|nr:hypothetical protein [Bifidobacteriaceae bacterium]
MRETAEPMARETGTPSAPTLKTKAGHTNGSNRRAIHVVDPGVCQSARTVTGSLSGWAAVATGTGGVTVHAT